MGTGSTRGFYKSFDAVTFDRRVLAQGVDALNHADIIDFLDQRGELAEVMHARAIRRENRLAVIRALATYGADVTKGYALKIEEDIDNGAIVSCAPQTPNSMLVYSTDFRQITTTYTLDGRGNLLVTAPGRSGMWGY